MTDYSYWLIYLSTVLALNMAPGPDLAYVISKTIQGGRKIGVASSLGVCTGALFHAIATAIGISAIITTYPLAFSILKFSGVAYLLYLSYETFFGFNFQLKDQQIVKVKVKDDPLKKSALPETAWSAYKRGILIDILNPKVAIFFMAFLPSFIREGQGDISFQLFYLGVLLIFVAAMVEISYVMITAYLRNQFRGYGNFYFWINRFAGLLYLGLAVKLALFQLH